MRRDHPAASGKLLTNISRSVRALLHGAFSPRRGAFLRQKGVVPKRRESTMQNMPSLRLPTREIVDRGTIRLGSSNVSGAMPELKLPRPETVDRGTIRLGSSNVSAVMPELKLPQAETADRNAIRFGSSNISAVLPPLA
ncbi:MAG TPA: hypothetical protein VM782_11595 [Stellaceae bacterium]|nr:hypothetical protein [Stellaceae bacterium]